MPKNKRPVARKPSPQAEPDHEVLAQALADLALELAEQEDSAATPALQEQEAQLHKLVRNALRKQNDELLYEAIELARDADVSAAAYLRGKVEEAAATLLLRRPNAPEMEIDAFALPLFVHSTGGLKAAETFQDPQAFELLVDSFRAGALESPHARVVLISHAYDLDEVDRISYCQLGEMVREAAASMTDKKLTAAPALLRSIRGWSPSAFGAADQAVELRFLLGFALKRADDPFYQVPAGEAEADAWFEARMERFRQWTVQAAPLVRRCLAADPAALELDFLYQDLFYGAKEQGMAEHAMLQMMSAINQALEAHRLAPDQVRAVVAPADVDGQMVLRVNLYACAGALLASAQKPFDLAADLEGEMDDLCDALGTLGIGAPQLARGFDQQGQPEHARPGRAR